MSGSQTVMEGKQDCKTSDKPIKHSKYYRIILIVVCVLVVFLLILAVHKYFLLSTESSNEYPCNLDLSVRLTSPLLLANESVVDGGVLYPQGHYFSVNGTIRGCVCSLRPCVRKCCGEGEFLVKVPRRRAICQANPFIDPFENFTFPVYDSSGQLTEIPSSHFWILYGDVCRNGKYILDPELDKHQLLIDGRICKASEGYIDASQYCLETMNGSDRIRTFHCFPPPDVEAQAMFMLYPVGMMISVPFMVATFLVYGVVSELRNVHGKSLMSQTASLCVTYVGLAIIQVGGDRVSKFWCVFLAFMVQFTFLAAFFWMNVMCFDIWWVFSGLRPPRGSAKERDHKKFVLYSVYAWGVPAAILAVSLVMDLVPTIPDHLIKPGFGVVRCWFKDRSGTLLYFYLPIAIVVVLNITMFVTTACKIKAHTKETKVLHTSESRQSTKADKDRFNLYLKLFVVMGINWVLELVSFFGGGPKSLWFVTDIGNTLQGVLIFVIFVCKQRVLRLVSQKLCPSLGLVSASTTGPSNSQRTTSSQVSKTLSDNSTSTGKHPQPQ